MTLKEQLNNDIKEAMKAQDSTKLNTLRMVKADVMKYEVSAANMVATDEVVIDLLKKGVKMRLDAIEGFEKGGNKEAADKERAEIEIIKAYLPAQMSEEDVKKAVLETIGEMNATAKDFGKVMGAVMAKTKGKTDGNVVSKLVKELLK